MQIARQGLSDLHMEGQGVDAGTENCGVAQAGEQLHIASEARGCRVQGPLKGHGWRVLGSCRHGLIDGTVDATTGPAHHTPGPTYHDAWGKQCRVQRGRGHPVHGVLGEIEGATPFTRAQPPPRVGSCRHIGKLDWGPSSRAKPHRRLVLRVDVRQTHSRCPARAGTSAGDSFDAPSLRPAPPRRRARGGPGLLVQLRAGRVDHVQRPPHP
jgi:hypothetical protein